MSLVTTSLALVPPSLPLPFFFSCSPYNTKNCVAVYVIYTLCESTANRGSQQTQHFVQPFCSLELLASRDYVQDQQGTPGSVRVLLLAGKADAAKADATQSLSVAFDDRVPGAFVPADPLQGQVTNDLGNGAEHTFSKHEGNTKLRGVTDTPVTIQRVLNRLAK